MQLLGLLLFSSLAAAAAITDIQGDGRPCGLRTAPCPEDQHCEPNDASCTDLFVCTGTCKFHKEYPDCGGFRPNPPSCPDGTKCVDDIRRPGCGMACDMPGICVAVDQPVCDFRNGYECPEGLSCYFGPNPGIWKGQCL